MLRLQLVVMGVAFIACCYAQPQDFPKFQPNGPKIDFKNDILKAEETARLSAGDGNKFISRANFKASYQRMIKERTKEESRVLPTDAEIEAVFKLYDRDHDNKIDMKEGMMGLMQHQEFFFYDINFDGRLDETELMYMYDTPHQATKEYSESVDFVEFYQRLQSHSKLPIGWESKLGKEFPAAP